MLHPTEFILPHIRLAGLQTQPESHADVTLLFLHGWLDNAGSFAAILQNLLVIAKQNKWNMIAIDLAGHGLSQHRSADNFYPFHDYIADVHQLLTQIDSKKTILIGHSLGALIASCYSAAFPENVAGLIQIEGLGPLAESANTESANNTESASNSVQRLRKGLLSRQRILAKPIRGYNTQQDACLHRMQVNHLSASQLKPLIERGTYKRDGQWYWRHDPKLRSESLYRMTEQQALSFLQAIQCPNLLILGETGYPQLVSAAARKAALSHHEEVTVPGGHHCHIESSVQVSDFIVSFVDKIRQTHH
ncbi:alpha/beta hydrolase [Vibrio aphrogenes]|uniref:alpha/beta hydrolase n=1 Tax=Vibrio aphrogenes TaxID=1891186 RepID=UPI000F7E4F70|nr:alpha/beta hydrolase [Vibrio aphrogenes]